MKREIKIVILFVALLSSLSLSAQKKAVNFTNVSDYILTNYHPDSVRISKFCGIGCIFIKFKINQQGDVDSLSFSGAIDSTQLRQTALAKAVYSLKQDTALISLLKNSHRPIIQPFIYVYQAGCKFPKTGTGNGADYYLSYISIMTDMNQSFKSLFNILKFKDGTIPYFDGILLNEISVNNTVMH